MSKFFILTMMLCGVQVCLGQTEVTRKNKITGLVTETYNTVITADRQIKQGPYQAMYDKKVVLAQGKYVNDERVGTWRFFDKKQRLAQVFNYDTGKLIFEAPEDSTSNFKYGMDQMASDSVRITKPLKLGGRYFGYLPYMRFFSFPSELLEMDIEDIEVIMELLISPMGRVADFKIHVLAPLYNYKRVFAIDPNKLFPEDRIFFPATLNKEPISSRILIYCYINRKGDLDMDTGN